MNEIDKIMNDRLKLIFNQFIEEKVGDKELQLMPPKDMIPVVSGFRRIPESDAVEISFSECEDCVTRKEDDVEFIEDKRGRLTSIRIYQISLLNEEKIRISVLMTIENEIKQVGMQIQRKEDVPNKLVKKRKLMFLDELVKGNYTQLQSVAIS